MNQTLSDLAAGKKYAFSEGAIRPANYRPFNRQWLYMDGRLNWSKYLTDRYFPEAVTENRVICLSAPGFRGPFSALMSDVLPSIHYGDMAGSQCFPLRIFEPAAARSSGFDFGASGSRHGVSDQGLAHFHAAYPEENIGKDDLFHYVYGLLHSEAYRDRFADNLTKELPRIPAVKTAAAFWAFVEAGRRLGDLHCDFDAADLYPVIFARGDTRLAPPADPVGFYRVEKMKFAGKRPNADRTTIIYNQNVTVTGIPVEAYDYVVNGKSAIDWVMERQCVKTDPASGIINDANRFAVETMNDPAYPLKLLQRVITVSLETMKIVRALPKLDIAEGR